MRATCLLALLIIAKVLELAGRDVPLSVWTPLAFLWQDLLFVLAFAAVDGMVRRPKLGWCAYGLAAFYVALNVPIARALSTPLTWPLLRAARGPLTDSILYYVTAANVACFVGMSAAAVALPFLVRRIGRRWWLATVAACVVLAPFGPLAASRVETGGLHRNVFVALVQTALPRVAAVEQDADWRASPFGSPESDDLRRFRGLAAGRHVVVIHLESAGAGYLRPYGATADPMPNLTGLCSQAILFEYAYTAYPETIKSFFAAHCATYPALDSEAEAYQHVRTPALAEVLASKGYRCGLFHSGRFGYLGMESVIRDRGFDTMEDAGAIGGERDSSFGIDEESTVRRMLGWIDALPPHPTLSPTLGGEGRVRGTDQRFFVTYLPIAGHHPYATPRDGPFPAIEEIDRYRNALYYADAALGQLVRGLRQRGLFDDTLFVIFGDHGEAFGQHEGNFGHVLFLHEENVHVPYLIVAPGLVTQPVRVGRVASLVDTAPTVLDLLGIVAPAGWQGVSLLEPRAQLALFCTDYSLAYLGLRDGRWKMIHELDEGKSKLFDLASDPDENDDVAGRHPELVDAYRDHLVRWSAAQKHRIAHPESTRIVGP
jgi:arylsulfatase A-like enzyme